MATWKNISLTNPITGQLDINNVEIELNRRLSYLFGHIEVSSIVGDINTISGTLTMAKGGTGTSLTAPGADSIYFYDLSSTGSGWLSIGTNGIVISETTLNLSQSINTTADPTFNSISSSSATFSKIISSSGVIGQISSTNKITSNTLASSSATIGQLSSTDTITANKIASSSGQFTVMGASSATLPCISSTNKITANTIASSSGVFTYLAASCGTFGNSTSYSHFESDGTYEMVGDSRTFRDELGDVTKLKVTGVGITDDSTDSTVNFSTVSALTDYLYTNVQLNHDRDALESIYPHIHWFQSSGNSPNFLFQYRWQKNGIATTTGWTNLRCNTLEYSYTTTPINQISRTTAGISAPVGSSISDIVQFRVMRDNINSSTEFSSTDNYSLPAKLTSFDVHIITNTIGSRLEYSK